MDDPRNIEELIMDKEKPITLDDVAQINKNKHHKNMQNRMHRIDDSYQIPGEKPMSTADKPTSKFMDAMTQVLANEAEIMEKKKMTKGDIAALAGDPKNIDAEDFAALRAKKHLKKEEAEPRPGTLAKIIATPGHPLRSSARKELKDREAEAAAMKKEEVEPLAELSKEKLKDYIKAAAGAAPTGERTRDLPTLAAATGRHAERAQQHLKQNDYSAARLNNQVADKSSAKSQKRRQGIAMAVDKLAKLNNSYEPIDEAATVLLRKGGATKRMRYNPASIARLKGEGWVVASEAFVDKVKTLFDIAEEISFEDALSLVEAVDEVKRGRGRPKKAVDPNAAPKREWTPGGRGRPPKNKDQASKVSTSDTKTAGPAAKAADDVTDTGHILDHLRKAISTNGTNSFRQKNGSMAKVPRNSAIALLTHHDKLPKASDRFQMQQHIAKSPEHLQNAIKNVAAGKPYNAGYEAKAKAKVSLAAPDWNDKK